VRQRALDVIYSVTCVVGAFYHGRSGGIYSRPNRTVAVSAIISSESDKAKALLAAWRRRIALRPSWRKKALTSTVESATALSMFFTVGLNLSGDLLFLFFGVSGAGWQLGVHAIHDLNELLPCLCSVKYVLGLEHNRLPLDGCL
jgi:hypothetical protein